MFAAKLLAPLAVLASAVSAQQDNGHWTLSQLNVTVSPSHTTISFYVDDTNKPGQFRCWNEIYGGEDYWFPCLYDHDDVHFATDLNLTEIYMGRRIDDVQAGTVTRTNGSAPLGLECKGTLGGEDCHHAGELVVPVTQKTMVA
ncbi:uncharacterized protein K452DRAFT_292296 [Aplosporella prunicola CBS 121167]|uniref:AA1-like domain-containing protein n=1 Tax=Aplosporella prunicola CBS 121167 TaxID=1176127 RepID=A0A6A6AZ83_9PEZI|nr:uncharacterized protein K452DRAFT_292296 [Aplosporella prunicola CBS 121167]KAF2136578.1 hypothetical protein K452DRAFT_292296 [Aplosporella prunicola CBS 121167]